MKSRVDEPRRGRNVVRSVRQVHSSTSAKSHLENSNLAQLETAMATGLGLKAIPAKSRLVPTMKQTGHETGCQLC